MAQTKNDTPKATPLVYRSLEAIEDGFTRDGFEAVSHFVAKHKRYPVFRCEIVYRDPAFLPDGKWYKFGVQLPNKPKPEIINDQVDHSKTRVLVFFVQEHEITEEGVVVDFAKRGQSQWKKVDEKFLRGHKIIVVGKEAIC